MREQETGHIVTACLAELTSKNKTLAFTDPLPPSPPSIPSPSFVVLPPCNVVCREEHLCMLHQSHGQHCLVVVVRLGGGGGGGEETVRELKSDSYFVL